MYRIVNQFPDELKRKIIDEYLNSAISQVELQKKYNIRKKGAIINWMRNFGIAKPTHQQVELQLQMAKEATSKTKRELELEARIKELEKDLDTEKFRTLALNTMIDVIERDLKIPVRKKPGAKQ
jgi:transposase-like protein